jgi:hypothetical protein
MWQILYLKFLIIKPIRWTNFSILFLEWNSVSILILLASCQQICMTYSIVVCTVKTSDDGQRNCPKHVEFHSKNKIEKLVHLVDFIVRNLSWWTCTWMSNLYHKSGHAEIPSHNLAVPTAIFSLISLWQSMCRFTVLGLLSSGYLAWCIILSLIMCSEHTAEPWISDVLHTGLRYGVACNMHTA